MNSPPASSDRQIPEDVWQRLEPVVADRFFNDDFHRVDMRSLGRGAGMSFATIYRHFGDKETLLFAFIERWVSRLNPDAVAALESDRPLKRRLRDCLAVHFRFYEANPQIGRIIFLAVPLQRWMRDRTYHNAALTRALMKALGEGRASGELRRDVPLIALLDAYSAVFHRVFLMWEYRHRRYSLTGQLEPMFAILWNGIASQPEKTRRRRKAAAETVAGA